MFTILKNSVYQMEIKKSKFITFLYRIETKDEIDNILNSLKREYSDATHCCYAYKLGGVQKLSDDGEPSGTAGIPIMEILNKKELDHILCVVIRYFGGIKLGAGGLIRAYSNAVRDAISDNIIIEFEKGYLIKFNVKYEEQKQIDYLFLNKVLKKEFDEEVIYYIKLKKDELHLVQNYSYDIIEETLIEKTI